MFQGTRSVRIYDRDYLWYSNRNGQDRRRLVPEEDWKEVDMHHRNDANVCSQISASKEMSHSLAHQEKKRVTLLCEQREMRKHFSLRKEAEW